MRFALAGDVGALARPVLVEDLCAEDPLEDGAPLRQKRAGARHHGREARRGDAFLFGEECEGDGGVDVGHEMANVGARAEDSQVLAQIVLPRPERVERHLAEKASQHAPLHRLPLLEEIALGAPVAEVAGAQREAAQRLREEAAGAPTVTVRRVVDDRGGGTGGAAGLDHHPVVA